jgi:hypothetical protein
VPSLDDGDKQWKENPQKIAKLAVVQLDLKGQHASAAAEGADERGEGVAAAVGQGC